MRRIRLYRVSAVVIRQRDLGEADRIATLYTLERGKLSAVAKGIKRTRSKLAGSLQLFAQAHVQLAAGRSLEVVTQAQPIAGYYHLREEMDRYAHACYVAELLDALTDEGDPDAVVYQLLVASLEALDAGGDPSTLVRGFELKLLARMGYGPELERCAGCGAALDRGPIGFSADQGGVLCPHCLREHGAAELTRGGLKAMRELRRKTPQEMVGRKLSRPARQELERLMRAFVDFRLERPLRSAAFLARRAEQEVSR